MVVHRLFLNSCKMTFKATSKKKAILSAPCIQGYQSHGLHAKLGSLWNKVVVEKVHSHQGFVLK